ncbi:M67 family metallopeptidase [Amycolatopsis thermophila]|uniref:Proteasome lid subunit RPN8/RPN11 n=1 Tax=Amycolatopsis thermophila TaxID=206084 RepID=A0ABU0EYX2_9PSEU|nr:M67 family metallopeptidase [Amycolatopsis thermophila]MDQ0380458.1 proteasome lid subunit RPN8/RPN11 [Amycolatopsis thermophila]
MSSPARPPATGPDLCGLVLRADVYATVLAHAQSDHPVEANGLIAALAEDHTRQRAVPLRNVAREPHRHRADPAELLAQFRAMDERGEVPLAIYHSHTAGPACPSTLDVEHADDPSIWHVIVATGPPWTRSVRAYRITGGEVTEADVHVRSW